MLESPAPNSIISKKSVLFKLFSNFLWNNENNENNSHFGIMTVTRLLQLRSIVTMTKKTVLVPTSKKII